MPTGPRWPPVCFLSLCSSHLDILCKWNHTVCGLQCPVLSSMFHVRSIPWERGLVRHPSVAR